MVTGNIPEAVIRTARGRSPRAVIITAEEIPRNHGLTSLEYVVLCAVLFITTVHITERCTRNIPRAVDSTAYIPSTEAFILWLPRLQVFLVLRMSENLSLLCSILIKGAYITRK